MSMEELLQLGLARLRTLSPDLRTWGLSATLGNLDEARHTLLGPGREGVLVQGKTPKRLTVDTLLPPRTDRFPWAGHLGLSMLPQVVEEILKLEGAESCPVLFED